MPALFTLAIETDAAARRAVLRLRDEDERLLEHHEVDLSRYPPSRWESLFDTRRHLRRLRDAAPPEVQLAELGRFLGEELLGPGIAGRLAQGVEQRTLLVRLADPKGDRLAAAFARVPWELAVAPRDDRSLFDRNVAVRLAVGAEPRREKSIALEKGEALRVLMVFAEAPGERPRAARLERTRLLALFFEEVLPSWNVEVDVLCHGVTRKRLREQVRERGGYHLVHWSGHGQRDTLEIALEEREVAEPWVSGEELADLLAGGGGWPPQVVFLGARDAEAPERVTDWASFRAPPRARERAGEADGSPAVDAVFGEAIGFTGTALALVLAGVKQVVAMRYEVGDRYARRLARKFYRGLLADKAHHASDVALLLARKELAGAEARTEEYDAVDHASPLVFGSDSVKIEPQAKSSEQMKRRPPQAFLPGGGRELDASPGFVGRGEELTRLSRRWLAKEGVPIALIQGLAGIGKTSLAAEAVRLWFDDFEYVLAFQAKGGVLTIEEFYRRLDQRLALKSPSYLERCRDNELAAIYLEPGALPKGANREEVLRDNLLDVLGNEGILLVLDNFETNLLTREDEDGYTAQDPAWDRLFDALGARLHGTRSRLLVTCRHKIATLANPVRVAWIQLGPLPMGNARVFFEGQPPLRDLLHGDEEAQQLAKRILDISRGHPLILGRIADLARAHHDGGLTPAGRRALGEVLDKIDRQGFKMLPDVFVGAKTEVEREKERTYLEEVAIGAVDLLIGRLSEESRRLLWVVTRAGESTAEDIIAGVWGKSPAGLLGELCGTGLLAREGDTYSFHELVAERAAEWMVQRPEERGGQTEGEIWTAYGLRYGATFHELRSAGKRELASEAGRRGIRYLVHARALERLATFASELVTGTSDPALLRQVIADLQGAAVEALEGEVRWSVRMYMADALGGAGRSDQALQLYTQAAEEAKAAQHWTDLGWIYQNWGQALLEVGRLDRARETFLLSVDAKRRGDHGRIDIVRSELAVLQVDVKRGHPEEALPAIEAKLGELRAWWARQDQGKPVPEAPDSEVLARTLLIGLDIAEDANRSLERWQVSLDLLGEIGQMQRAVGAGVHEQTRTHFNSYYSLRNLGKLSEAKTVLEGCLDVYRHTGDIVGEAGALSALADVWNALGDSAHALLLARTGLTLFERLPDPGARAISHRNLAIYLHATGATSDAIPHQVVDLVYCLATGLDPRNSLHNLAFYIRESAARNERFTFPSLTTLLAAPAFAPLRAYLTERALSLPALQSKIVGFPRFR